MQTYKQISEQIEIVNYSIKRAKEMDTSEVGKLEQDKDMLEMMLEAIPTSIDMNDPDETKVWLDRFIADKIRSMTLEQLAWFWTGYRFGYRDSYYRREWTNRLKRQGYHGFICHMDGGSMRTWKYIHDLWFNVTFLNIKPEVA